jgi:hypothetical protein
MRGRECGILLVSVMLGVGSVQAASEVTVDWETGEMEVRKEDPPEVQEERQAQIPPAVAWEKDRNRLRSIIKTQQAIILKQQEKLQEQQAVIRRQNNVIRGLDLLRRQGK